MKPSIKKFIGAFLFLVGVIMLSASQSGITGNIISDRTGAVGSILSLVLIVGGLVVMVKGDEYLALNDITRRYELGEIDAVRAGYLINEIIPIQNVKFRTGKQHSIVGADNTYPISLKEGDKAIELAIMGYLLALENNPKGSRNNNIEISRKASTKHHMNGFLKLLNSFKSSNAEDLEGILSTT